MSMNDMMKQLRKYNIKKAGGHFPVVQRLRLGAFTARTQVQSLLEELRSHKLSGMGKKKKKKKAQILMNKK